MPDPECVGRGVETAKASAIGPRRDNYVARNNAADSPNAIHGDGAARYGFARGLVPGITLLAYVCESLRMAGGEDWLHHGYVRLGYRKPVYDGERVTVDIRRASGPPTRVELRTGRGQLAVSGLASIGDTHYTGRKPDLLRAPVHARPVEMIAVNLVELETLRSTIETITAEQVAEDLGRFDIDPSWYLAQGAAPLACVAKSYFPFSDANFVRTGPSLLVENELLVTAPVKLGEPVTIRGRIDRLFSRNGRRYITTELGWFDGRGKPLVWEVQTSIYHLPHRPNSA